MSVDEVAEVLIDMQSFSYKSKLIWMRLVKKRTRRNSRILLNRRKIRAKRLKISLIEKKLIWHNIPCIKAPEILALSTAGLSKKEAKHGTEHTRFVRFKNELQATADRVCASGKNQMMISFLETQYLYADACILLIAVIDSLKTQYPQLRFLVQRPNKSLQNHRPTRDKYNTFNVDAVFCHIGLYKLLGYDYTTKVKHKYVQSWHYVCSDEANGDVTNPIFDELEKMKLANLSELYGGVIEGISNAVEHAYNKDIKTERNFVLKRWWMLIAEINDEFMLYVCDLGHGIPNTLRFNKDPSLLQAVFDKVKGLASTDSRDIKVATLLKATKTKLAYRGKGGQDIKTFIDKTPHSRMSIYSNRGLYRYNNNVTGVKEKLLNNELSIDGTLLHWAIPFKKKDKL